MQLGTLTKTCHYTSCNNNNAGPPFNNALIAERRLIGPDGGVGGPGLPQVVGGSGPQTRANEPGQALL